MATKGHPLRLDEIDAISEVWEGFTLMDRHGIAKDNCACLKDIQDRLRLHYQKLLGQGKSTEAVSYFLTYFYHSADTVNATNNVQTMCRWAHSYNDTPLLMTSLIHIPGIPQYAQYV